MKRDQRLRQLSSEHHNALVLARKLRRGQPVELPTAFEAELAPHFALEERVLLPALARTGREDLATRTLCEHDAMRAALSEPQRFAELLEAHVRFEERELFPTCEELIPDVLDELAHES
jgi:hemerythrin-like domain-containing protein